MASDSACPALLILVARIVAVDRRYYCCRSTAQLAVQLKYTSSLQSIDHSEVRRSFWANTVTILPVSVLMR